MQVGGTMGRGHLFGVASAVACRVGGIHLGRRVQWLVHVTDVVDDHAQRKRLLIVLVAELLSDLLRVRVVVRTDLALQELGQCAQSLNHVNIWLIEVVVGELTTLVKIGDVDEVPFGLEAVPHALDVVRKR